MTTDFFQLVAIRRVSLLSNDNRFFSIGSNRDSESGEPSEEAARNLNFQNIPLNDTTALSCQRQAERQAHFEMTQTFSTFRPPSNVEIEPPNVQLEITSETHELVTSL